MPLSKLILPVLGIFIAIIVIEVFLRVNHIAPPKKPGDFSLENVHPFLQHQLTPSLNKGTNLHVNSFGFNADPIRKKKPEGTYRIFIQGGSTVLNRSVPYDKNVST